jgi:FtsP/CotA-like multicopper oxidase with cupredoxin domain
MVLVRRRSRANDDESNGQIFDRPNVNQSGLPSKQRIISTVAVLSIIFAGVFFTYFPLAPNGRSSLFAHLSQNDPESHVGDEGYFVLHPAKHVGRNPTTWTHQWRITKELRRPDGVLKPVYCINGDFPGPTLEVVPGDRLIIEVQNCLDNEGVSIHWHGLSMREANAMDGAVGITQASIAPVSNFTYNFTIADSQHGSFWYHAHDQVQRAEGLYGGLIVHSAKDNDGTADERLILVSDWYHRSAEDALHFYMHPGSFGNEPVPDSILLNGLGAFSCEDAVLARPLDCRQRTMADLPALALGGKKRMVLRVINVGSYAGIELGTSSARLHPLRVDCGHKVSGHSAKRVGYLYPGERVDLEITHTTIKQNSEDMLDVTLDTSPFKYPNPALTPRHRFPILWRDVVQPSHLLIGDNVELMDLDNLVSTEAHSPLVPTVADETMVLYAITQKLSHLGNEPRGFMNQTSWSPQAVPPAPLISLDRKLWDKNQFVPKLHFNLPQPLWLDIVLNNLDEEGHPFHLHGYDFWVLSTYSSTYNWGSYNPFEDEEAPGGAYNFAKAIKKDTLIVPRRGYAVLRVRVDNPGLWMFHCHNVSTHNSTLSS